MPIVEELYNEEVDRETLEFLSSATAGDSIEAEISKRTKAEKAAKVVVVVVVAAVASKNRGEGVRALLTLA